MKFLIILFVITALACPHASAQTSDLYDTGELQIALKKLNKLGSVLYLAAHPDDENTTALAYLSKESLYRTGYLSLTRGDGGQNLIGPEKGAEIGIIRTQELLQARQIDGAEQFFTHAIDFGYSKTPEETYTFWDKDTILADVVYVIRSFKPDVIITRFPVSGGGHGHHTASAQIAKEAYTAAADPSKFPDQLKKTGTWQAKRMLWNSWRPDRSRIDSLIKINVGDYNPLLGKSYTEIAALSRSMHKTQGFGASGRRGNRSDYFEVTAGAPASEHLFEDIDTSWNRIPGGSKISVALHDILVSFDPGKPAESIKGLFSVYDQMSALESNHWVELKKQETRELIKSCAGLWMEAIADGFSASPGDQVDVRLTLVNRSEHAFHLESLVFPEAKRDSTFHILLENNNPVTVETSLNIPKDTSFSQPYWLKEKPSTGMFAFSDKELLNQADNQPSLQAIATISSGKHRLSYSLPVRFRWNDRVKGELYRPFEIRPPVTLNLDQHICIFQDTSPKEIRVKVKSHSPNVSGEIKLTAPKSWQIKPTSIPFTLNRKYEEQLFTFTVTPPSNADEAVLQAEARINGSSYGSELVEISYPHIGQQVYFPDSRIKVVKLDIAIPGGKIAYIMGAGDTVPDALRNIGYDVTILDDELLDNIDLSKFDTVITGVRAYNTRGRLIHSQQRLLQYVENGGTMIVQYNVTSGLLTKDIGPYPFTIGRDRISVEGAQLTMIDPSHRLFSYPNSITNRDFDGWVQERGLYFATRWDDNYTPLLYGHDPGESEKKGGMLYAEYGKGVFIFSGYSWFRQLPAGVPGAYKLFVNLISAGTRDGN